MSTPTLLADLVRRQTASSFLSVLSRTVDRVAEDLAQELLRDPEFRDEMRELVRAAFLQALRELQQPTPSKPDARAETEAFLRTAREASGLTPKEEKKS